jgi:hypothetical protein
MYRISDQQIDYILSDIGARGVEMESLQQNLLDHVCCIIENNLEENGDFESFYNKTIQTFYKDELWEIEEETLLLLTYKNYYTMKKIMINSGIAAATFFIIGSFFKFMHWQGAAILILLGMVIGALIYLPLLFLFKKNETTESRAKLVLAIGTINGILFCTYSLFKVFHWPGASMIWFFTLGLFSLVFIPLYFFNGIKNPANKVNTITTSLILIIVAGVFFLQTNVRPQARYISAHEIKMINDDDIYIKGQIDSLNLLPKDSINTKWIKNVSQIYSICNELKTHLIVNEFGFEKFPDITNKNGLLLSTSTFNDYADRSDFCREKFNQLSKLTISHIVDYIGCEYKLNIGKKVKRHPSFSSSIMLYDSDLYYYNNTILGAYKDLQEVQLKYIYETQDLILCKKGKF